jgi:hypothetical protein
MGKLDSTCTFVRPHHARVRQRGHALRPRERRRRVAHQHQAREGRRSATHHFVFLVFFLSPPHKSPSSFFRKKCTSSSSGCFLHRTAVCVRAGRRCREATIQSGGVYRCARDLHCGTWSSQISSVALAPSVAVWATWLAAPLIRRPRLLSPEAPLTPLAQHGLFPHRMHRGRARGGAPQRRARRPRRPRLYRRANPRGLHHPERRAQPANAHRRHCVRRRCVQANVNRGWLCCMQQARATERGWREGPPHVHAYTYARREP